MIENILIRKQTPTDGGKYLYRFDENSNRYYVSTCVYLGKSDTEWDECTEEQKLAFEKHNEEQDRIAEEKHNEEVK